MASSTTRRSCAGELEAFARAAGGTLVELTTTELTAGASPDPARSVPGTSGIRFPGRGHRAAGSVTAISALAEQTGLHIVLGTEHYRDPYLADGPVDRLGIDALAAGIVRDLVEGSRAPVCVRASSARSGRQVVRLRTGGAFDPGCGACAPRDRCRDHDARIQMAGGWGHPRLARRGGVAPEDVIMGHCSTIDIPEYHQDMAARGVWLQFDTIRGGPEPVVQRWVDQVMALVRAGCLDRILLSHDVCLKSHLRVNGGCGYTYLFEEFLPRLGRGGPRRRRARAARHNESAAGDQLLRPQAYSRSNVPVSTAARSSSLRPSRAASIPSSASL